jgi:predicted CoA-substrate-specific enzyme activase
MSYFLGIDVGSVSTKLAALDSSRNLLAHVSLPTRGEPIAAVNTGLAQLKAQLPADSPSSVAVTGSARRLIAGYIGANLVKNEISAQAAGGLHYFPGARCIIEIGGQDSKIILLGGGLMTDFGMNTVCAAGTGSFLDHQAQRLGLSPQQFGSLAMASRHPVKIAGGCTVFAESDMIHRQQSGEKLEDIIYGLCRTLAQNYLTSAAAGKEIEPPVVFQGGLARNSGMVRALEEILGFSLLIPLYPELTGAVGAALLAMEESNHPAGHIAPPEFQGVE